MTSPTSSNEDVRRSRAKGLKLFIVILFAVSTAAGGFWVYQQYSARGAVLTTNQITELAKSAAPAERAQWLRLARGVLAAERVQPVAAPVEPINNRGETSRVELGYLLFFDPILSGDKTTACASCHHPDHGMADGLKKAVGKGGHGYGLLRAGTGPELQRNTPSLFNAAFNTIQFWDGRAGTLEEQMMEPMFSESEMSQGNATELLKRLRAIPQYRALFAKAFGFNSPGDGREITLSNLARAIAAYERKLNITETAYDHFVKGQDGALSNEQLRGMVVFFGQGQCVACHIPPHFHDGALSSLGVPATAEKGAPLDADPGFGAVLRRQDSFGMFKTPGLRNVARTAPYMHNGVFNTLEEVIDFYNDGGGRGRGLEVFSQDTKVAKLNLSEQQKKDLVSFLKALNDLAPPPQAPPSVPSGLPVGGK